MMKSWCWDPDFGSNQNYINPLCILMERQRRTNLDLPSSPTIQAPAKPQPQPAPPGEEESYPSSGSFLDPSKTRKGMLQQPPGRPHTHRHPRIPEYCQDATCLFYFIENAFTTPSIYQSPISGSHWRFD